MPSTSDCPICAKHRGAGPLAGQLRIWHDDLVAVFHAPGPVLGHLFVETRRHTPSVADLTDDEAAVAGLVTTALARGLRAEPWVASVHTAVAGLAIAHYHQHLLARTVGTPDDVPWHASDTWERAHRGDDMAVAALCGRLHAALAAHGQVST